ncbi:hypothetical protein GNF98_23260 [Clostridium perfringens]
MAEADNTENAMIWVMAAPKRPANWAETYSIYTKLSVFPSLTRKGNGYNAMPRFSPAPGSI